MVSVTSEPSDRDPIADRENRHTVADFGDRPGDFVTKRQRVTTCSGIRR
jgi:hypothetical protein